MEQAGRILLVDDNPAIHEDYRKILAVADVGEDLASLEADLFGEPSRTEKSAVPKYRLTHAMQGLEAIDKVMLSQKERDPYAVAFVDVRMPPGIDGIMTVKRIWEIDPHIEVVICSAYSDYAWREIVEALGASDQLLVLHKPFDAIEVEQATLALYRKWVLRAAASLHSEELERRVAERTEQLRRESQERLQLETELRHAQKLEAVGRLASGVAHELNTPIQFIGDGVHFVQEANTGLFSVIQAAQGLADALEARAPTDDPLRDLRKAQKDADLEFLMEELPAAIERTLQGVGRVAEIVRAMRGFARLEGDRIHADLNAGLRDTLTVARNEYKLVADVETDFGEIPRVLCHAGDMNQVFLNLIVNAAHAIEDRIAKTGGRGTIRVATRKGPDKVVVEVADNGCGIPEDVRERIFDPFFTTKQVGRGTGQGLTISRSIVVDNHKGALECDSVPGQGTTFRILLPLEAA